MKYQGHIRKIVLKLFMASLFYGAPTAAQNFTHPGIMHNMGDFKALRSVIDRKSGAAYASYSLLTADPRSRYDYALKGPFRVISRDGEFRDTKPKMEMDFSAAYLNSIQWAVTGDERHAQKSMEILLAYADSLQVIPETNDAPLLVGLEGFKIIYAAEVLKSTYKEFDAAKVAKISALIRLRFLPVMEKFYRSPAYTNGNWGAIVTKAYMAAGIFFDDRVMYRKAIDFYLNGNDNGTIKNYVDAGTGQIQESGRDQGHSQLGIGALATVCEIAFTQGDDLYKALDDRLLKGFEYVARYNLGNEVPFATWKDVTGKYSNWTTISEQGRGKFLPVYEMVYHHYVVRRKLKMPFTEQVLQKIRPEGFDRDQPAFGTFLFSGR